jgi:hypothetical protein
VLLSPLASVWTQQTQRLSRPQYTTQNGPIIIFLEVTVVHIMMTLVSDRLYILLVVMRLDSLVVLVLPGPVPVDESCA